MYAPLVEHELKTFVDHLGPYTHGCKHVIFLHMFPGLCYSIFSFICLFRRSLFVILYFFVWLLCCLFFDIRILITSLLYLQTLPIIDKNLTGLDYISNTVSVTLKTGNAYLLRAPFSPGFWCGRHSSSVKFSMFLRCVCGRGGDWCLSFSRG